MRFNWGKGWVSFLKATISDYVVKHKSQINCLHFVNSFQSICYFLIYFFFPPETTPTLMATKLWPTE